MYTRIQDLRLAIRIQMAFITFLGTLLAKVDPDITIYRIIFLFNKLISKIFDVIVLVLISQSVSQSPQ